MIHRMQPTSHRRRQRADQSATEQTNGEASRNTEKLRIAYYSHDTMGLGHLRRNMLIAQSLLQSEIETTNLMITGAHEAKLFEMPDGIDCLTLPHWHKMPSGSYRPGSLDIAAETLTALRSGAICSALDAFDPDLFIVDKVPRGLFGELEPVLDQLAQHGRTRCVLGLRDVLDDPEQVRQAWKRDRNTEALDRWYDEVWIYGDTVVFDAVREYGFPNSIAKKVQYTGYLDQSKRRLNDWPSKKSLQSEWELPSGPLLACAVGGGQDGEDLAEAFVEAIASTDVGAVLLTGPFMPPASRKRLRQKANANSNLRVFTFLPEADILLRAADRVVAMGGYNTVCAVLSFNKQALIVPRVTPRREQLVRAECLDALGLVELLRPEHLSAGAIMSWLDGNDSPPPVAHNVVDMNGLARLPEFVTRLAYA